MNVMITTQSVYYAGAIVFALVFWLFWRKSSKNIGNYVWALMSVLWLLVAIGWDGAIQFFFGGLYVLVPYAVYSWIRDRRDDSKQQKAAKIATDKVVK